MREPKAHIEDRLNLRRYLIIGSMLALFFGILVYKDATLPKWLILMLGIVGLGGLFFKGFRSPELVMLVLVCYIPFSKVLVGDFGGVLMALNLTNILVIFLLVGWFLRSQEKKLPFWDNSPLNFLIYISIFIDI